MTQLLEYALIENNQITRTEWFKRPCLVPEGDWRVIGEITPDYDPKTHTLGNKTLQILEDGQVAYVSTLIEIPPVVRQRVTKAALKIAAGQLGLLAAIETFVAQLPFDAPAKILWKDASEFQRSNVLWNFFATQLDLSSEDVDNLFNMAGQTDDAFG
jgi:hypothetical protein